MPELKARDLTDRLDSLLPDRINRLKISATAFTLGTQSDDKPWIRQDTGTALGPFHQQKPCLEKLPQANEFKLFGVCDTIEIEMKNPFTVNLIRLDEGICRAFNGAAMTDRLQKTARQRRFTRPEITEQMHNSKPWSTGSKAGA